LRGRTEKQMFFSSDAAISSLLLFPIRLPRFARNDGYF